MKPVPRCAYGVAETVTTEPLPLHGQQRPWKFDLSQDYRWMDLGADCPVGPCFTGDTYGGGAPDRVCRISNRLFVPCVDLIRSRPPRVRCCLHTRHGETQHLGRARVEIPPGLNSTGSRVALGPAVGCSRRVYFKYIVPTGQVSHVMPLSVRGIAPHLHSIPTKARPPPQSRRPVPS